jgi:hypothetical protein
MAKSIPVFSLNLNNQFIFDKWSDNGHPKEPFVQINGGLLYYKHFLRDVLFIIAPATTKVFEYILILVFKFKNTDLSETRIYLENHIGYRFDFRYCNHR